MPITDPQALLNIERADHQRSDILDAVAEVESALRRLKALALGNIERGTGVRSTPRAAVDPTTDPVFYTRCLNCQQSIYRPEYDKGAWLHDADSRAECMSAEELEDMVANRPFCFAPGSDADDHCHCNQSGARS